MTLTTVTTARKKVALRQHIYLAICLLSSVFFLQPAFAAKSTAAQGHESYSPHTRQSKAMHVFWGDTHVHTNLSIDAFQFGNKTLGPDAAYRFAKGEEITASNGIPVRRDRPLDFLVIADHAETQGILDSLYHKKDSQLLASEQGKQWYAKLLELLSETDENNKEALLASLSAEIYDYAPQEYSDVSLSVWQRAIAQAEAHNQPGVFTAFIGFEWSPEFNLHRVVIFKDGADFTHDWLPFTSFKSHDPEALWRYMERYEAEKNGEVLAIPHNSNLSNGVMFALENAGGRPLSREYASQRMRWEPLLEVTQMKGDSETHPLLSPNDEFADFERIDYVDRSRMIKHRRSQGYTDYKSWYEPRKRQNSNNDWMRPYEYSRSALKLGLQQSSKIGVNPFKFGVIGSTDTHTSLSTADENNFWGKLSIGAPVKDRLTLNNWGSRPVAGQDETSWGGAWKQNAAGYAAVWAEENTREAIFAAMKRKEVYASTGPRISLRFFGGWDYHRDDAFKPDLAHIGYSQGVPMGGDLSHAPDGLSPRFIIHATKDPEGANLDRVQVIKGWQDSAGETHEKIYNVALSGKRQENANGKVQPVGSTVDIAQSNYTNTIGSPLLAVVWEDPDFNPKQQSFYYVRALEIPTPRWTAYDAKYFNHDLKTIPDEILMSTQERVYSSPIWYSLTSEVN